MVTVDGHCQLKHGKNPRQAQGAIVSITRDLRSPEGMNAGRPNQADARSPDR
ncbi:hypothetical protein ACIBLA_10055 [Streptomyces sp. NPDC050433]|uniref:hypothetical protein n=1 Tax=unclassified Streptomyces TaxID=2593676 RepID=UPI0034293728